MTSGGGDAEGSYAATTADTSASEEARTRQPPSLAALSQGVRDARDVVSQRRRGPVVPTDLAHARQALIVALHAYTRALEARHLPVPHALRSELDMHRRLFD